LTYKNILIIKLSAIGDVIHALPVAPALKQRFPQAKITWIVEQPAYDLLTNNPCIDEIIVFEKPKFKSFSGFFRHAPGFSRMLRERRFDLVLDLQGLFKSAAISLFSGATERLVYCHAREGSGSVGKKICGPNQDGHIVEQYLDVVREMGCTVNQPDFSLYITETEAGAAETIASQAGLAIKGKSYIVLIPGTNWPSKCWPVNYFAQLAEKIFEAGHIPVFVGSKAEAAMVREIVKSSTLPPIDLTGKTTLKKLAHIMKNACAVVAGDTGPMHLAAALNTPVVALFGPTCPRRNGPYGSGHLVLTTTQSCQGCWKRKCPEGKDCMADISIDEVFKAVNKVVREQANTLSITCQDNSSKKKGFM